MPQRTFLRSAPASENLPVTTRFTALTMWLAKLIIVKDVSDYISISESTLYPILKRLEANQAVAAYSIEHKGRLRKYYHLTHVGHSQIQNFLQDWDAVMKAYHFILGDDRHE